MTSNDEYSNSIGTWFLDSRYNNHITGQKFVSMIDGSIRFVVHLGMIVKFR